jgi:DNA-binding NarL/FixJ family response regulator
VSAGPKSAKPYHQYLATMSFELKKTPRLDRILVIDDLPLIPLAFQEVFRSINPSATVDCSTNIFTALSSPNLSNTRFDLVITAAIENCPSEYLQLAIAELKNRFDHPMIMIYSSTYDPLIIEQMTATGIHAYVHKFESIDEIRKAYCHLARGESFISGIFHTLYYEYGQGVRK